MLNNVLNKFIFIHHVSKLKYYAHRINNYSVEVSWEHGGGGSLTYNIHDVSRYIKENKWKIIPTIENVE